MRIPGRHSWCSIWKLTGQEVSHNLLFFDTMHNIDLPAAHVDASLQSSGDGYSVTLRSPTTREERIRFFWRFGRTDFG